MEIIGLVAEISPEGHHYAMKVATPGNARAVPISEAQYEMLRQMMQPAPRVISAQSTHMNDLFESSQSTLHRAELESAGTHVRGAGPIPDAVFQEQAAQILHQQQASVFGADDEPMDPGETSMQGMLGGIPQG